MDETAAPALAERIVEQRIRELQARIRAGDVATHLLRERVDELQRLLPLLARDSALPS